MSKPPRQKNRMVSIRMTEAQFQMLESIAELIQKNTGFKITRASIMIRLMKHGLPILQEEFPYLKSIDLKTRIRELNVEIDKEDPEYSDEQDAI